MGRKNTFPNPRMEPGAPVVTRTNLFTNPRSVTTTEVITRRNLLINPSFEAGLTGWSTGATAPIQNPPAGTALITSRLSTDGTAAPASSNAYVPLTVWPTSSNTGVQAGVTLTAYTGPLTITTDNTVIDSKTITGDVVIQAANVMLTNCHVNGNVYRDETATGNYSFTVQYCYIDAGQRDITAVGGAFFTALRCDINGGNRGVYCYDQAHVEDCVIHNQWVTGAYELHASGLRMGQNGTIRHNSIVCDVQDIPVTGSSTGATSGASASLTGYGDYTAVTNNLIDHNFIRATPGGFSAYGGSTAGKPYSSGAHDIRFINNVFERGTKAGEIGGVYGPIKDYDPTLTGNQWTGNTWDTDGNNVSYVENDPANAPATPGGTGSYTPLTEWPSASNTGVPAGTTLTTYTGPGGFTGTQTIVIDSQIINDDLRVYDSVNVTLTNCVLNGHIDADSSTASVKMVSCEVNASSYTNAATGFQNLSFYRCNIHGGITSINSSVNGYFEDCYLWGQYVSPTGQTHTGAFLCSGGHDIYLKHCVIWNDSLDNGYGGGPSAAINLYGDFAPLTNITFDHCYTHRTAGGYEASFGWNPNPGGKPYGDNPTGIVVKDCVFERGADGSYKGGAYGTITSFKPTNLEPTNLWQNNIWDDGTPIPSDI